jgi:hypothetical protein
MVGEAAASDAKQSRGAEQEPEEEEGERGSKGPSWNLQNLRDLTVNKNSPLILSSNEKMVKMKVVELFKIYNFALGLKFINLKYKVLFHHFALNSNLIKFLSLTM